MNDGEIVLECKGVGHGFEGGCVLYDVNLKIARGQFVGLVGSSGVGKSTLLRAILGTHPAKTGQILMNGQPVTTPGRDRGIVYQRYSLFPFLTVQQNVAFGLMLDESAPYDRILPFGKWRRLRKDHLEQAAQWLRRVKLHGCERRYPSELSGGMSQRVALAQALIMKPEILLLDEPFGALDEAIREEQQNMLLELYKENLEAKSTGRRPPYTIVLVTHELNEAMRVSDRVVALSRFWLWEEETKLPEHPGASIVYDAVAPEYRPGTSNGFDEFLAQRTEVREAAFEPDQRHQRGKFVRFWREVEEGKGIGIMKRELAAREENAQE